MQSELPPIWDEEVDVLVVGSGAGSMVAAATAAQQGATTLVIEKTSMYGGTSATCGGGIWIPASHSAKAQDQEDSPEEALEYLTHLIGNEVPRVKLESYVNNASKMAEHVESISGLRFNAIPYTDYHAELPGGKMGYRSHETNTLDARELPAEDFQTLRPTHPSAALFGFIPWTTLEAAPMVTRAPGWLTTMIKIIWRYASDIPQRLRSRRSRFLVFGNAIIGHLKLALNKYNGKLWLNAPLNELYRDESGRVVGAVIELNSQKLNIKVNNGVILGAGGFERNQEMRDQYLPGETQAEWSGGMEGNTGDTINIAAKIGAATDLMEHAWWTPVVKVDSEDRGRPLFYERALPGNIIVDQNGERYTNEARSYDVVGKAMIDASLSGRPTIHSWIIFDRKFRMNYPMGPMLPLIPDWLHPASVRRMFKRARSLTELANQINVEPETLEQTVSKFNEFARTGNDIDFHRGDAAYDQYYGDHNVSPNPNLAVIEKAPYYAVPVYPGEIGTKGGLATDEFARALDTDGDVIDGLYVIGNNSASVMGSAYPGAGSTLGPAMTFGYVAALDALNV
ncbi:MAG: FAD-binding protein [Gammaproteobacteria bacterium]|jgi:3-oxosteroid 1-dehydrogenase|nr:FAD-binding protein [Gammaproteobacteria bacterium]